MGVRDTSKLPTAALIIILVLFGGALAQTASASAHVAGKAHHRARHLRLRHTDSHHGKPSGRVVRDGSAPRSARPHVLHSREGSAGAKQRPAVLSAAATIASVLATPCQNTEITPDAANVTLAREAVLCLVNRVRAEHSLAPLKPNPQLQEAAESHNAEMLQVDYFAHVSPNGETPVQRIRSTGYIASESVGYVIGENLAWGTYSLSTPKAIVAAWIASPGHLANILESRYTETGVGVTAAVPQSLGEGAPGATYAQEFGVIVR